MSAKKATQLTIPKTETIEIKSTIEYGIFKFMNGNRPVDKNHVRQLVHHMAATGNMTDMFPITVNENMYVLDGQHRLKALEILKWPVGYRIIEGASLAAVRAINGAQKNWGWRDFALGWKQLGNQEYAWFLRMADKYPQLGYRTLMAYTQPVQNHKSIRQTNVGFRTGEYKCDNKVKAEMYMDTYVKLSNAAEFHSREFAVAMLQIIRLAQYSHARMAKKLEERKDFLQAFASHRDNLRQIEDVYNFGMGEGNRARLF